MANKQLRKNDYLRDIWIKYSFSDVEDNTTQYLERVWVKNILFM
ncbi:hypothetical protein T09_14271 [Trichinella sp. T9]|nr:hypothetical protein T09_14271 [Trichinella sp. T9]